MNLKTLRLFLLLILVAGVNNYAHSQVQSVKSFISAIDALRDKMPAEKLYIQFDKPYYSVEDTIWLKAYLFDGSFMTAAKKSGVIYMELANDTNRVVMQRLLTVDENGVGSGNMVLKKDEVPEGAYTLRAYTNMMRNFGEAFFFKKSFYVGGNSSQSWLVNAAMDLSRSSSKDSVTFALKFYTPDKTPVPLREMEIRLMQGRRTLQRDKAQTRADGTMDLSFGLPAKGNTRNMVLVAEDRRKNEQHKLAVPLIINRPENIDLQFMPEGGALIAGRPSRIGFKAVGEDGSSVEVSGKIYAGAEMITGFRSVHKGIGSFSMIPKEGQVYMAKLSLPGGSTKDFSFPQVKSSGTALSVINQADSSIIRINVAVPAASTVTYYVLVRSKGIVFYGAANNKDVSLKLNKSMFPTGIINITLLDVSGKPVNERMTFIDHHDDLKISVKPHKTSFGTRDSISLEIDVKDKAGRPVNGSFSIAVTDNKQVKNDSLAANILSTILLSSDLKGTVEDPGYYFACSPGAAVRAEHLENLLLTQGWSSYQWEDIMNPAYAVKFKGEPKFEVKGSVTNIFNNKLEKTPIQLVSARPGFYKDSLTRDDGTFTFTDFPEADTLAFLIQAKNKNNKSFNVGIKVDEFKAPPFDDPQERPIPWYVNTDSAIISQITTKLAQQNEQMRFDGGGSLLSEVKIVTSKWVKDSKNLNGPGGADFIMDEKDLFKAKKTTLLDMLEKKYPQMRTYGTTPYFYYVLGQTLIKLIVDGVWIEYRDGLLPGDAMEYLTAEDIKGIEVMTSYRQKGRYFMKDLYKPPMARISNYTYIEITTYSGNGAYLKKRVGTYFYRSIPFAGQQVFYSPKYTVKSANLPPDKRSTIFWEPQIITDAGGKARVSFYSAQNPGTYTFILEGSDMDGRIGRETGTITVK